jgi:hypothetical protein
VEVVPLVVEVKLTMLMLSEFLKRVVVGCPYGTLCVEAVLQTACVAHGEAGLHFALLWISLAFW